MSKRPGLLPPRGLPDHVQRLLESVDRFAAAYGSLDARQRLAQLRIIRALERHAEQLEAAPSVLPVLLANDGTSTTASSHSDDPTGKGFDIDDAPLLREMERLIEKAHKQNQSLSETEAAKLVAPTARGQGSTSLESKAHRLRGKYRSYRKSKAAGSRGIPKDSRDSHG